MQNIIKRKAFKIKHLKFFTIFCIDIRIFNHKYRIICITNLTSTTWHDTGHETNALNLIEGREALIESPDGQFEPFVIHYAESVCIPATIKRYTITPCVESEGKEVAVMKTFVRF